MVGSRAVKEPVRLAFFFLLYFLCAEAIFSILDVFGAWGLAAGSTPFSLAAAAAGLPRGALHGLVPAVVTALVLAGLRMARRPFSRFVGLAICLAGGYVLIVNGVILMSRLAAAERAPQAAGLPAFPARSFLRVGDRIVSADAVRRDALQGVLVYGPAAAEGRFSVYPAGRLASEGGSIQVRLSGRGQLLLTERLEPPLAGVFRPDRFTGPFLRDISVVTEDLRRLSSKALGQFFLSAFSLVFLWTALLAILRFTRWPLINLLLLAAAVRGSFFLYHTISVSLAPQLSSLTTDPVLSRLAPSIALIVAGVFFLLIDILFIPADRWKQVEAL
jgi:hypothetical protein